MNLGNHFFNIGDLLISGRTPIPIVVIGAVARGIIRISVPTIIVIVIVFRWTSAPKRVDYSICYLACYLVSYLVGYLVCNVAVRSSKAVVWTWWWAAII